VHVLSDHADATPNGAREQILSRRAFLRRAVAVAAGLVALESAFVATPLVATARAARSMSEGESVPALLCLDQQQRTIHALRASDGTPVWRYSSNDDLDSVQVHEGALYLSTRKGAVLALRLDDRSTLWEQQLGQPILPFAMALASGTLFINTHTSTLAELRAADPIINGDLIALRTADGTERWRQPVRSRGGLYPYVVGARLYLAGFDGTVQARATVDGAPLWDSPLLGTFKLPPPMFATDDTVYLRQLDWPVPMGQGILVSDPPVEYGVLAALSARDGSLVWKQAVSFDLSSPLVSDGVIYLRTDTLQTRRAPATGTLLALRAADGANIWRSPLDRLAYPVQLVDGVLFAGSAVQHGDQEFELAVYALRAADGGELWQWKTASTTTSGLRGPLVGPGAVYLGLGDDGLLAREATSGKPIWHTHQSTRLTPLALINLPS
jgi:outer membrane protein assembly factor BamB